MTITKKSWLLLASVLIALTAFVSVVPLLDRAGKNDWSSLPRASASAVEFNLVNESGDPSQIEIADFKILNDYKDALIFEAAASSSSRIMHADIYYYVYQYYQPVVWVQNSVSFTSSTSVNFSSMIPLNAFGQIPLGVVMYYYWVLTDYAGNIKVSSQQSYTFADRNSWQSVTDDGVTIWWYQSSDKLVEVFRKACKDSFKRIKRDLGMELQHGVNLYIYPSTGAYQQALHPSQSWAGGQAFHEYNTVAIGCTDEQISWGKETVVHELTHLATRQLSDNAYTRLPNWLNEGISVYAEGPLSNARRTMINNAKWSQTLFSVEALSSPFPSDDARARLAYAQSYSFVEFLMKKGGSHKIRQLLDTINTGVTFEESLQQIYGFNMEEMTQKWFKSIGAPQGGGLSIRPVYLILGALGVSLSASLVILVIEKRKMRQRTAVNKSETECCHEE